MRRNLLVKGEGNLLGRKTSLCQGTKDPGVFKYCIQGCQGRCCVESRCRELGKEEKVCWGDSREPGSSGEIRVTSMPALFHCLSASPWTDALLLVMAAVRPLSTPGHHWSLAQEGWSVTSWGSLAPRHGVRRWRVMPQGYSQFHIQQRSLWPTSLPLSLTALRFMFCGQYPALYWLHHQQHQVPIASSSLHHQGEGTILRVGSQTGACRNPWASAGRRTPSAGHVTYCRCWWALWQGQCLPQNQSLESKGPSGTLIILK